MIDNNHSGLPGSNPVRGRFFLILKNYLPEVIVSTWKFVLLKIFETRTSTFSNGIKGFQKLIK